MAEERCVLVRYECHLYRAGCPPPRWLYDLVRVMRSPAGHTTYQTVAKSPRFRTKKQLEEEVDRLGRDGLGKLRLVPVAEVRALFPIRRCLCHMGGCP